MNILKNISFFFSKRKALKITLLLTFILVSVFWVLPYFLMINTSFKTEKDLQINGLFLLPQKYITKNYDRAIKVLHFSESFFVSVLISVVSNISIIFFSSLTAWQLARSKTLISKIIFYLFLITMIVPFQAIMLPLMRVMKVMNMQNIFGLMFMYTGFGVSISIFMMHGFLSNIPLSLEEVAKVEGYNPLKVYFLIILPLLKPIITTILILNTLWIWNDFLLPLLVYQNNISQPTTVTVRLYTGLFGSEDNDTLGMAAGLTLLIIPIIIFFIIMQKNIISGITNGSIK
ncbi:carbohydrate ABC transporter permease [Mesomycoplasma neurolyticum]|uniref:Maltose transport system permease protein malG n=1 Tax=Mesomycoplasma neurolyticum TaxID=2120 RepID=A0A449A5L9_9BACT|nr:carbohydrate ABC transporter permease [Mesomycoplasma neurolyticum]VEU59580.1 Maltose transport system permease protein malG [Mesomycoplasma neurolyticum]